MWAKVLVKYVMTYCSQKHDMRLESKFVYVKLMETYIIR